MTITQNEIDQAVSNWGQALVAIATAYDEQGIDQARALAETVIDTAYGYNLGPVLFKPTLASGAQTFRTTRQGALSYFVGHDSEYPGDSGFALKGWRSVTSETAASFIEGDAGMWMGWIRITDKDGQVTTVDKSFGYKKDENGTLRIVHHHSSLPFEG